MKNLERLNEVEVYATYYLTSDKRVHIGKYMCQMLDGSYAFNREGEPIEKDGHHEYLCVQRIDYVEKPEFILRLWNKFE